MGRADGRGVLMGCQEPLAGGVGAVHSIGGVWFGANRGIPAGIWRCFRLCYGWGGGLRRCHGVVTAARNVVGPGRCAETSYARRREWGRWSDGWKGLTATGCQRLWWRSWRWRWWVNDREKHSTPGNAGSSASDGVVRRRRNTWPSAVDGENQQFGCGGRVSADLCSVYGWRARHAGCQGRTTMTRSWSPSSAGIGIVRGRAVVAARVVTFDMSGSGTVIGVGATLRDAPSSRSV
jgi:hypothetical protein